MTETSTITPFNILQITQDADERDIKRAYAKLLKQNRPDENPIGFQQLQHAYTLCLAHARDFLAERESATHSHAQSAAPDDVDLKPAGSFRGEDGHTDPDASPHTQQWHGQAPTLTSESESKSKSNNDQDSTQESSYFEIAPFVQNLHGLLAQHDPAQMHAWLHDHEALYSIGLKHALRPVVIDALASAPEISDRRVVNALLMFFGLDRVGFHDDLSERAVWILQKKTTNEHIGDVLHRMARSEQRANRWIGRELAGQASRLLQMLLMLIPTFPNRIRDTLDKLRQIDPALDHPRLDAGRVEFWYQATDRARLSRARLVMVGSRLLAYSIGFWSLVYWLTGPGVLTAGVLMSSLAITAGIWIAYEALVMGWIRLPPLVEARFGLPPRIQGVLLIYAVAIALSAIPVLGPLPAVFGSILAVVAWTWRRSRALSLTAWATCAIVGPLAYWPVLDAMPIEPASRFKLLAMLATIPVSLHMLMSWHRLKHPPKSRKVDVWLEYRPYLYGSLIALAVFIGSRAWQQA